MSEKIILSVKNDLLTVSNNRITIEYYIRTGFADFISSNGRIISQFYSEITLGDKKIKSTDFQNHFIGSNNIHHIKDSFGEGIRIDIENSTGNGIILTQSFYIYEELPYFIIQVSVSGQGKLATNYMAPVCTENSQALNIGENADTKVLFVPYDNDKWIRYEANPAAKAKVSYEVTAIYDKTSQQGLVAGSLTHDVWKTGIAVKTNEAGSISGFKVYNGAADEITRDVVPHGYVCDFLVSSSKIFVGWYKDYKEGLVEFTKASTRIVPALSWDGGVPFGWNSWAALENTINFEKYVASSDFIKNELQHNGFNNDGVVYVNYDSFWTSLTKEQLAESVQRVNKNGQKAGIYYTPFAFWGKNFDTPVEGSEDKYKYSDILLRDYDGKVLPDLDGGYAIDPTHPANIKRVEMMLKYFVELGFEYVKLDFMAHGALEGVHFNKDMTTGVMAYNYGMSHITRLLDRERTGRNFFINLSIAPLFPYQYAHSRRVSCDAFGSIADSEYMLNSVTYGWWINNNLYKYNDPDHVVLYRSFNKSPISEEEAQTRFNASVIAGTVLLFSEDVDSSHSRQRCIKYLLNEEVNNLAGKGVSFRPLYENEESKAANVFILKEEENLCYLALFNYNPKRNSKIELNVAQIFQNTSYKLEIYDLWKKTVSAATNTFEVTLKPCESKILKLTQIVS